MDKSTLELQKNSIKTAVCFLVLGLMMMNGCKEVFTGKREARGVWLSRFEYANVDSTKAQAHITEVFEKARAAKMNMVFFQVRGNGDAFYRSHFEPWSDLLSGTLGKDPGWDPLEYAVREAHRLGLEIHAWVNTFPVWRGKKPPIETTPRSLYLAHPEWIVCDANGKPMPLNDRYVDISPGIPEARRFIINVVLDIVEQYDVDGVQFDYIRYPEDAPQLGYSHDSISVARFKSYEGNPYKLDWDNWEREQVNQFVYGAYNAITELKPWVKVSASVIGKYSGTGWTAYNSVYQDVRRWMELGKMDFVIPMVYWEMDNKTHPFGPLVTEWTSRVSYDRPIIPGILLGLQQKFGWPEIEDEVEAARERGAVGVVFFSSSDMDKAAVILGMEEFPYWSDLPAMTWKDSVAPQAPVLNPPKMRGFSAELSWNIAGGNDEAVYFNLYRSASPSFDPDDVKNLLVVTARNTDEFTDSTAAGGNWYYGVSALNRAGNESKLSNIVSTASTETATVSRQ
ncbi:MAG TPA: family 10 glycosylhydrolase [Bacteroidota bacterium]|nr:family 10 glycosylhydrolase [Bacteroidota bacterium]